MEAAPPDSPSTRHSALAIAVLFFVNGATFSNWLPRIPEIRDRLGLGNAGLGATLLGGGWAASSARCWSHVLRIGWAAAAC